MEYDLSILGDAGSLTRLRVRRSAARPAPRRLRRSRRHRDSPRGGRLIIPIDPDKQQPAPPPTALASGNGGRKAGGRRDDNPDTRRQATTNNPDGRGRGAGALWAPHTGERPPPPPNPQTWKAVPSFFIEMACVFFIHGAAHTNSANLFTSRRGGEAGGNKRPQRNARSAPPADNSPRAQ